MTKQLISFPSSAMVVSPAELPAVSDASRAVVQEAKDAGVWVFGGGRMGGEVRDGMPVRTGGAGVRVRPRQLTALDG